MRRAEGATLSEITAELAARLGVVARLLPMTDQDVRTRITTPGGVRTFQEYLVKHGAGEEIERIELAGVESARPAPGLLAAIADAERIVICPSSPVVSIGTILAVSGVREALAARRARTVAVSPIIGGRPVEGPADRFLAGAGYPECSATQMARIYADVAADLRPGRPRRRRGPPRGGGRRAPGPDRRAHARSSGPGPPGRRRPGGGGVRDGAPGCVVPVKPLDAALGRLGEALGAEERRALQAAMLTDLLRACAGTRGLGERLVVTADAEAARLAAAEGARAVADHHPPRGMNAAVRLGARALARAGARAALVLVADLPLARAEDLEAVLGAAPDGPGVVLAPSRDGTGTNALLIRPPRALAPRLGPESLGRHLAGAARRGLRATRWSARAWPSTSTPPRT